NEGGGVFLYSSPTGGSPTGTLPEGIRPEDLYYELPGLRVLRITKPDGTEEEVAVRFRDQKLMPILGGAGEPFTDLDDVRAGLEDKGWLGLDILRKKEGQLAETPMRNGRRVVGVVELDFEEDERERAAGLGAFFADHDGVQPIDIDAYCEEFVRYCRIQPTETPADMFYRCWGDNSFELARLDNLSTFAADVDTASYALARNYLERGLMPTKEQIRTEEFVNYFDSGVPAPIEQDFAIDLELAPSLFGPPDHWMLRVVVAGREVDETQRQDLVLTLVVDVSGSMKEENRIELVKHAARLLVGKLTQNDAVGIVVFSDEARLVLPMTSAANRPLIETAIDGLHPDGSTNAEAGLKLGYELAAQELTAHASNYVVLFSDGVANVGNVEAKTILAQVAEQRAKGIYLNTIGVGMGNHNDVLLEQLADRGDGISNYLDSKDEAYRVLVENFTGAFQPIARDVKLQVEFDPLQVESYRQLGYENRAVADADFRNDAVDAGELGSGHRVTALYEIKRVAGLANSDKPLATARVRYKDPFPVVRGELSVQARQAAEEAREIEAPIAFESAATSFSGTTAGFRQAVLVAQFAELLRRSVHARGDSYDVLAAETEKLSKELDNPVFTEFRDLVVERRELIHAHLPEQSDLAKAIDELCRYHYIQGQLDLLAQAKEARDVLDDLERVNAELEAKLEQRIRDLIKAELAEQQARRR
ncbi:MAG: von Willebrand factor type A domain-containing protein, partial [Planctomycetota bacterium]|nr:von Willebrand factor type A domain-containing protein [Planctomycetota bacterium]